TKRGGAAGGLNHHVGAAAAAFRSGGGDRVLALGIHAAGCAHALREFELGIVDVDGDDFRRAGKPRALHRSEPDRAAADHHHRIGVADMAMLNAAPTPVITPQPIRQARSNGMSRGTAIACCSCTMQYSPKAPMNIRCLSSSPLARRALEAPSNCTACAPLAR